MIRALAYAVTAAVHTATGRPVPLRPKGAEALDLAALTPAQVAAGSSLAQRQLIYAYVRAAAELDDHVAPLAHQVSLLLDPDPVFMAMADRVARRIARAEPCSAGDLLTAPSPAVVEDFTHLLRRARRVATPHRQAVLTGLRPALYEHPEDRIALDAMRAIPGFDRLVRWFVDHGARYLELRVLASNVEVTRENMPELHSLLAHVCGVLQAPVPSLYIVPGPLNAYTTGTGKPMVVISQSMLSLMTEDELAFVLGHEVGHILSGHVIYHNMAKLVGLLASAVGDASLGIGTTLFNYTFLPALYYWMRRSEFTCDRAGLLACQSPAAAITVLAKLGGLPLTGYRDFDPGDFIRQATHLDAELENAGLHRLLLMADIMNDTHPRAVWRAATLQRWVDSGEYEDLAGATTHQRRYLASRLGDDPLVLPFIDDVIETVVHWARPTTSQEAARVRRAVRRMIRLGEHPTSGPPESIFAVDVQLEWASADSLAMLVTLVVLSDGQPRRVEIKAAAHQAWSQLPKDCRAAMFKSGAKAASYSLYRRVG